MIGESFDKSRCCVIMAATRSGFVNTKPLMLRQLTLLKRGCHGGFKHRAQESETLCRKGGTSRSDNSRRYVIMAATSRSDNAPHASRARAGAKLACGSSHDHYARSSSLIRGSVFTSQENFLLAHCVATNLLHTHKFRRDFLPKLLTQFWQRKVKVKWKK